jgi:hypothetical protein
MLHIGQILYDNDPRYSGRTVEIIRIDQRYVLPMHSNTTC